MTFKYEVHIEDSCVSVLKIGQESVEAFYFAEGHSAEDVAQELHDLLVVCGHEVKFVED